MKNIQGTKRDTVDVVPVFGEFREILYKGLEAGAKFKDPHVSMQFPGIKIGEFEGRNKLSLSDQALFPEGKYKKGLLHLIRRVICSYPLRTLVDKFTAMNMRYRDHMNVKKVGSVTQHDQGSNQDGTHAAHIFRAHLPALDLPAGATEDDKANHRLYNTLRDVISDTDVEMKEFNTNMYRTNEPNAGVILDDIHAALINDSTSQQQKQTTYVLLAKIIEKIKKEVDENPSNEFGIDAAINEDLLKILNENKSSLPMIMTILEQTMVGAFNDEENIVKRSKIGG